MAINRFQNPNILVETKVPVLGVQTYDLVDAANQRTSTPALQLTNRYTIGTKLQTEKHIYSANNLIHSAVEELDYDIDTSEESSELNLLVTPEKDVRLAGVDSGYYSVVYNFLKRRTGTLKIININSDGTEVEVEADKNLVDIFGKYGPGGRYADDRHQPNLVLNFGENRIHTITDLSFENNPRNGETVANVKFPTDKFNGKTTFFAPSIESEGENRWIEFYTSRKTTKTRDIVYETTGRSAKFNISFDEKNKPYYEIEKTVDGNGIYYSSEAESEDRQYDVPAGEYYDISPTANTKTGKRRITSIKRFSKVRYYDESFRVNEVKRVILKLYKPLEDGLLPLNCKIDEVLRDSYIDRVLVYPTTKKVEQENFSAPNFKIDMGNYGKSTGTDLKSWNDLLDANLTTSQRIVDKYISSSFGGVNLNVDYTYFGNFVKYSSAVERVNNFKYKLELIESYDKRIKQLNSVSGSEALTNVSQSISRKNKVVSGMDGWERWMYNESTGSLYTHYSSSNYPISPWPKQSIYPPIQYSVTSSEGEKHYNGLIESASIFDALNDARLTKVIPSAIVEDTSNQDYILFIDMIGHHFDITWSYINSLTSIHTREEHPYDGMPNELLYDVAKTMGWKLTHGKDRSELWEFGLGTDKFGNVINSGSLRSKSHEQVNYEVWRRIVNNIPYLLKSKGTARAVKALVSTYGIPQTFLSIREYGGPVIETDVRPYWEHERFVYHLDVGNSTAGSYVQVPWGKIDDVDGDGFINGQTITPDVIELQIQQDKNQNTAILEAVGTAGRHQALGDAMGADFGIVYESTSSSATYTRGNIHFYLNSTPNSGDPIKSASITDVPLFDGKMSTLIIEREKSTDDISQDNTYKLQYRRAHKDRITISRSASISIDGATESGYNASWTGSSSNPEIQIGKRNFIGNLAMPFSDNTMEGALQEIRYWASPLKDIVIDEHTLSRETYHGNSATSSFYDLKLRLIPDSQIKNWDDYDTGDPNTYYNDIDSSHPNQRIDETSDGRSLRGRYHFFSPSDLSGVTEEYYTKVPSAGANNIMNNKVRIEKNRLTGILDSEKKKEKSQYDSAPVDSNVVGVYLSATRLYNEDIYNHTGYFDIDDYIGNPDRREGYTEQNEELDYVRREVFRKYASKNLINSTIDTLAKYDMAVFEQIRQTMPARADYNSGILIEPHILERPKAKSKVHVTQTRPVYETVITTTRPVTSTYDTYEASITGSDIYSISADRRQYETVIEDTDVYTLSAERRQYETVISDDDMYTVSADRTQYDSLIDTTELRVITAQKDDLENLGNPQIRDMYAPATYEYTILSYSSSADVGFGSDWTTGSNGYWNYNALGTMITGSRVSKYASKRNYFYDNALSASLKLSNSSSLEFAEVSTDELPLAVQNLRFLGCKLRSDSLTANSPDTSDGRPVIEVFTADPNVLIYTSQTAEAGNLDVDTSTGLTTLDVSELSVNEDIRFTRMEEYKDEVKTFRRKLEKLIEIEDNRAAEFDARYKSETIRRERELERRDEFNILNGDSVDNVPPTDPPPPPSPISATGT